ncbi:ABC transporter substrate-binding protein [Marinomonas foliarum]|uniref:ABC transporter substrate-binding protein n=1 Tax=Marinomonas foliarum TaxID=491950 RepID=A0ABX7ILZ0_9GAMM|nr:ABC transporter substrate-binding protein [Marinomonas foliarum]QRV22743.1 ABC transporter substrate-binding protein [Marinomonas foliarum]
MNKNTLLSAIALFAVLVSNNVMAAEKNLTLMLDWFVNPGHGPIIIAKERGYFEQAGLQVKIEEPADPSTPAKLVAAGKVDLAVSYQPNLTMDVSAGLPLIRASTLVATPLNTLLVLDNGKNDSLADLKGKKIGISISGNEEATLSTMLGQEGVKFSDVNIINVGWALSSSLASGKVDAIWGGFRNFEINQLALEGYKAKAFYPEEHGVPSYDELIFVANANTYNKEDIEAFNKAIQQATTYIVNHPSEAWEQFVAYAPDTLNNELNKRAWNDSLSRFALRPAAVDFKRYDDYAHFLYDHQIINTLPKAKNYVPTFD